MSAFVQIIDLVTDKLEEFRKLSEDWEKSAEDSPVLTSSVCVDRDWSDANNENLHRYLIIAVFPTYASAQENNERPETQEFARRAAALCHNGPTFTNLDEIHLYEKMY
jgi:hypothetical protein